MSDICPYVNFEHGADRDIPLKSVHAVTLHRTGNFGWDGNRSAGLNRLHSTPGTFQFLIGREDGQVSQFYPANCYCTHAAGANEDGPGIEFEGPQGEPLTPWQIAKGGEVIRWLADTYGVPIVLWDGPRIDVDWYDGFVNHASVQTDPRWQHQDGVPREDWDQMVVIPSPPPKKRKTMATILQSDAGGEHYFDGGNVYFYVPTPELSQSLRDQGAIYVPAVPHAAVQACIDKFTG